MRIYAIIADDKKNSLLSTIFNEAIDQLKELGHVVDVLNLYDRYKEIPFYFSGVNKTKPMLADFPFYEENKKRFLAADRLILVYPIFWFSMPGIMKCWLDLITNFAWIYEGGLYAKPLHKIKRALIINTSMNPAWYMKFFMLNATKICSMKTLRWMGIKKVDYYNIPSVFNMTQKKFLVHMRKISKKCLKLVNFLA